MELLHSLVPLRSSYLLFCAGVSQLHQDTPLPGLWPWLGVTYTANCLLQPPPPADRASELFLRGRSLHPHLSVLVPSQSTCWGTHIDEHCGVPTLLFQAGMGVWPVSALSALAQSHMQLTWGVKPSPLHCLPAHLPYTLPTPLLVSHSSSPHPGAPMTYADGTAWCLWCPVSLLLCLAERTSALAPGDERMQPRAASRNGGSESDFSTSLGHLILVYLDNIGL